MPQVRKANPEKNCFLQSDKLYIDSKIYVYNEVLGQVVEHSESVRYGDMMSRPGSMMMMGGGPGYIASRPGSRTGSRPTSGEDIRHCHHFRSSTCDQGPGAGLTWAG